MKVKYLYLMMAGLLTLTSCMDDWDKPNTDNYSVTSTAPIGEPTTTINELKETYASTFKQNNAFIKIEDDVILEGVIVANDEGGNLYQTLVLAQVSNDPTLGTYVDPCSCIQLAVKNTCLYPYFQIGQMVRVNINGLYIGCYSKMPKIGQPYFTSSGNLRLGPMLMELCKTNIQLIGKPSDYKDMVHPLLLTSSDVFFTKASAYQNYSNVPAFVTIEGGVFADADGEAILAPYELHDAGYGVDRVLKVGNTEMTVRTSTQNDVSFLVMPQGPVRLTGILSYYDGWQLQLRSVDDMEVIDLAMVPDVSPME